MDLTFFEHYAIILSKNITLELFQLLFINVKVSRSNNNFYNLKMYPEDLQLSIDQINGKW